MENSGTFVEIDEYEKDSRIKRLVRSGLKVKIWFGAHKFHVIPDDLLENDTLGFTFREEGLDSLEEEKVYISFEVPPANYFSRGTLVKDDGYSFVFDEPVFRYEKRKEERIRLFPTYKMYVFFNLDRYHSDENVIPLKKEKWLDSKVMNEFASFLGDDEGRIGFRLIDFSEEGLSFLVNEKEAAFFESGNPMNDLVVDVQGEKFEIPSAVVKYVVDYIDTRSVDVPMCKVGLMLSEKNDDLMNRICEKTGFDPVDDEKTFEDFLVD